MKRIIKKLMAAFGVCLLLISFSYQKAFAHPRNGVTLQVFYDELSNYGDWIDNPDYGYVWQPNVGRDFKPYYTNGHWVMTEYGNTWVSDYEWGWAPFHYGRWFFDRYDGWIWMPDTEWGPAWVSWRTGGGYYGWAPLGPRVNINISIGRNFHIPSNHWVFIPQRCIYYPSYGRFFDPRRNNYFYGNTTIINNVYINNNVRYASGPRVEDVRRATRQNVPVYRIADDNRPGSTRISRNEVKIYRPEVSRGNNDNSAPRAIANNAGRPNRTGGNGASIRSSDGYSNNRPSSTGSYVRSTNPRQDEINDIRSSRPDVINRDDRRSIPTRTERSEGNSSPRTDASSSSNRPDRVERPMPAQRESAPTRTESSSSSNRPDRVERPLPTQRESEPMRTEPNPSNNRAERPSSRESMPSRSQSSSGNSSPQRVERSQQSNGGSSSSSRGSSSSSRGESSSSSNGRPSR